MGGELDIPGQSGGSSLDQMAAFQRADVANLDYLMHALADKLTSIMGLEVTVRHRRSRVRRLLGDLPYVNDLHSKTAPIESIRVQLGPTGYQIDATESSITCSVRGAPHESGMANGQQPFAQWIKNLMAAIGQRNQATQESLASLHELIVYDHVE